MALRLEQKEEIVAELNLAAQSALSAVISDYRGLTVSEMTDMRVKARATGVYLRVVRNTLVKRALEGTDFECLSDAFIGPTMLAFSQEEPGSAARLIKEYSKEFDALEVKALSIGGELLDVSQLERVAKLPTKEEAISQLMSVIQAPVIKLARTLNEVPAQFVRTLAAVRDYKQTEESA